MGMYYSAYRLTESEVEGLKGDDDALETFIEEVEAVNSLDLDKAWHGIYFLLTGTDGDAPLPAGQMFQGKAISDDWGYGPAKLLSKLDVKKFAKFLENLDEAEFKRRFDFERMQSLEIYPAAIWERKELEDMDWVGWLKFLPLVNAHGIAAL